MEDESSEESEITSSKRASCSSGVSRELGGVALEFDVDEAVEAVEALEVAVGAVVGAGGVTFDDEVRIMLFASCSAILSFLTFSYSGSSVSTSNLHIGH